MQEKLTIARPYAAAAFDFAAEQSDIDAWADMLNVLGMAVTDENLAEFIGHPKVTDEQMFAVLESVLGDLLNPSRRNFITALMDAERLEIAPQVAVLFEQRRAAAAGIVTVEVSSAYALSDAEQDKIKAAIKSRTGRECRLDTSVDATLIGGAVIKVGDSVTDLSLRGRLNALGQQLA